MSGVRHFAQVFHARVHLDPHQKPHVQPWERVAECEPASRHSNFRVQLTRSAAARLRDSIRHGRRGRVAQSDRLQMPSQLRQGLKPGQTNGLSRRPRVSLCRSAAWPVDEAFDPELGLISGDAEFASREMSQFTDNPESTAPPPTPDSTNLSSRNCWTCRNGGR